VADTERTPDFFIRLVGGGITPRSVPTRSLTRILGAIQRIVDRKEEDEDSMSSGTESQETNIVVGQSTVPLNSLRLVSLRSSSAGYGIVASDPGTAIERLRIVGSQILKPEDAEWASSTLSPIQEISDTVRQLGDVRVEIRPLKNGRYFGDVIAKITSFSYAEISQIAMVQGHTSVLGEVQRVGGITTKHCGLTVPNQSRMIYCQVETEKVVKELGRYLFQTVLVTGLATWLKRNWEIKTIKISAFEPPKDTDYLGALHRMREAGGKAWDKVRNPDKRLAEIRGI
jgi:hypothetical protein